MNKSPSRENNILILGIGNILLQDEGVGIHAIKYLEQKNLPKNITLLDGGTGGFTLLSDMLAHRQVIIIDAMLDDSKEGTITIKNPSYSKDFPINLSAHDIGLKELIDAAILLNKLPEIHLVAISVKKLNKIHIGMTPTIENVIPDIYGHVLQLIKKIKAEF